MNSKKNIEIVKPGDTRYFVANLNFRELPSDKTIIWKNKVYTSDEVGQNPLRVMANVEDNGVTISSGRDISISYEFKKNEADTYIKFYSYVGKFSMFDQFLVFYVEEDVKTDISVTGGRIVAAEGQPAEPVSVGQVLKVRAGFSVDDDKVPSNVRDNVKWMVRVDGVEERLIINGLVIRGGEISFNVPTGWNDKNVVLKPYLSDPSDDATVEFYVGGYVLDIATLSQLHDGKDNDGNDAKGLVYDKMYEFEALFSTEEIPVGDNQIKWEFSYINEETGETIVKTFTGTKIALKIDDPEMLGQDARLTVYVGQKHINNRMCREIDLWVHNRFRWLKKKTVESQISDRTTRKKPWDIDQGSTSLCGMACIFYLFAKEYPEQYAKFARDLFRKGTATHNDYTVTVDSNVAERKSNDLSRMPEVDYITLAGTRNSENPRYKGGSEQFQAINWPNLMTRLLENLVGYSSVSSKGCYNPLKPLLVTSSDMAKTKINDINKQLEDGYRLVLMIDSDLIEDDWSFGDMEYHWVVLESPIVWKYERGFLKEKVNEMDFSVFSWTANPFDPSERYLRAPITWQHFIMNYYGYIKVK